MLEAAAASLHGGWCARRQWHLGRHVCSPDFGNSPELVCALHRHYPTHEAAASSRTAARRSPRGAPIAGRRLRPAIGNAIAVHWLDQKKMRIRGNVIARADAQTEKKVQAVAVSSRQKHPVRGSNQRILALWGLAVTSGARRQGRK